MIFDRNAERGCDVAGFGVPTKVFFVGRSDYAFEFSQHYAVIVRLSMALTR